MRHSMHGGGGAAAPTFLAHATGGNSVGGGGGNGHRRQKSSFVATASNGSAATNTARSSKASTMTGQRHQQPRGAPPGLWLSNGSVSALNNGPKTLARNKSFAVVGSNNSNASAVDNKQRNRFAHIQPLVDTGKYSMTRHAAHMKEWLKDNGKRADEKFRRIKAATVVQYILADAEHHFPNLFGSVETRMAAGDSGVQPHMPAQQHAISSNVNNNNILNGKMSQNNCTNIAGGDNMYNSVKAAMNHNDNVFRHSVMPAQLYRAPKYVLIDVRLPHDFHRNRLRTAKNFPYTRTANAHNPKDDVFRLYENHPETVIIVYDDDGDGPSTRVASFFAERNMNNIHLLTGGLARVYELFPMLVCGKPPTTTVVSAHGAKIGGAVRHHHENGEAGDACERRSNPNSLTNHTSSASVIGSGVSHATAATPLTPVDNRYFNEDEIVDLLDCMARRSQRPTVPTTTTSMPNNSAANRRGDRMPHLAESSYGSSSLRKQQQKKPTVEKLAQRVRRQLALRKEQYNNKLQHSNSKNSGSLPQLGSSKTPAASISVGSNTAMAALAASNSESNSRTLLRRAGGSNLVNSAAAAQISSVRVSAERHRRRQPWKP